MTNKDRILIFSFVILLCAVAITMGYLYKESNDYSQTLEAQHVEDSTAYACLQDSLRMSEGREERAQATAEERLIWVGNLASEKDSLKQVNAQLQKKLDKQQSVLDSVIAVYTAKAQQAEAEMQKLEEDIRSLELQLSDVKVDRAKIQADLTNQLVRLRTMTAWRDYYRAMAARTILQKLFGSGKVPMPDMPEIAGL